ncbi:MAG: 3-deoxy-manno-octulosonate cytidylyltransferase [Bacteroidetes bacterium]|nr:3-deoxy-manno-octulosonate cytidylyltransferase [bacterium]NBP66100.1 3-deoxy-manno-octulosonate cytidylyltransferase [Bacteroidota bacterium]
MKILGVIPARMAASRFPDKPMAKLMGMPMIGHCYFRSCMCDLLNEVYVATCDQVIVDYIESIGGKAVMTSDVHERASERTAEALLNIEAILKQGEFDIVVLIQGDEPLIRPEMISEVIEPLLDGTRQVSNLMMTLTTEDEINNPNNVKVVVSNKGNALYMSREAIPSSKKFKGKMEVYRQLGLIAFSRKALLGFVNLEMTKLEIIESVDMNRFIENEIPIFMRLTYHEADSVDTPEDLIRVDKKMSEDSLFEKYKL